METKCTCEKPDDNTCDYCEQQSSIQILKEAAEKIAMIKDWDFESSEGNGYYDYIEGFIEGAKWQAERMYSEEDMRKAIFTSFLLGVDRGNYSKELEDKLIEQFKKGGNNE